MAWGERSINIYLVFLLQNTQYLPLVLYILTALIFRFKKGKLCVMISTCRRNEPDGLSHGEKLLSFLVAAVLKKFKCPFAFSQILLPPFFPSTFGSSFLHG